MGYGNLELVAAAPLGLRPRRILSSQHKTESRRIKAVPCLAAKYNPPGLRSDKSLL